MNNGQLVWTTNKIPGKTKLIQQTKSNKKPTAFLRHKIWWEMSSIQTPAQVQDKIRRQGSYIDLQTWCFFASSFKKGFTEAVCYLIRRKAWFHEWTAFSTSYVHRIGNFFHTKKSSWRSVNIADAVLLKMNLEGSCSLS